MLTAPVVAVSAAAAHTAVQGAALLPELASEVGFALDDSGAVRDSAAEDVRRTRTKVRTVEARLRSILKVS